MADRRRLWVRPDSGLVWSMNCDELAGAEELLDGRHHRADVDQRLGRDGLDVLGGHALAHHPLHAGQADADLVLDQLADRTDPAVGEVVLVVEPVARLALGQVEQVGAGGEHLGARQHALARLGALELDAEQLLGLGRSRGRACGRACSGRPG